MICIRTKHGKEVRVSAPTGITSGTLSWNGGEIEIPVVNGELVISSELAIQVPCPEKILDEISCLLTLGDVDYMVIYICKP